MRICNAGHLILSIPETRRERMRGLLGRFSLNPFEAMLLERCRSIHSFGMRFEFAVAWLDVDMRVLSVRVLRPGRLAWGPRGTNHALECRPQDAPCLDSVVDPSQGLSSR